MTSVLNTSFHLETISLAFSSDSFFEGEAKSAFIFTLLWATEW